jgi:hypothetical protein
VHVARAQSQGYERGYGAPRPRDYEGTFAHEYQHLLESYVDADESWSASATEPAADRGSIAERTSSGPDPGTPGSGRDPGATRPTRDLGSAVGTLAILCPAESNRSEQE